jgi:hypothetical protein
MRITRDLLLSLARDNCAKMAAKDRSLVCVYLVGSLLREEPFLGGVTDIDLVCVHDREMKPVREILRVNADVHFDITRLPQSTFEHPRALRTDPWLGCPLDEGPLVLRDPQHWFDYTRAGASAQFWNTEHVLARVNHFTGRSRQAWQQLVDEAVPQGIKRTEAYLEALAGLANAVACLTGAPLPTRRLLLELPERAMKIDLPEFTGAFASLFTSEAYDTEAWNAWTPQWLGALDAIKTIKDVPLDLIPTRRNYYEKAAVSLADERPAAALWIMLRTWTTAAAVLPKAEAPYKQWQAFIRALGLDGHALPERIEALDALLDNVESTIDAWGGSNG